jgi:hypothetical protein
MRCEETLEALVDLSVLRGWSEPRSAMLRAEHLLPCLATLSLEEAHDAALVLGVYGPEVLVGRYHPPHGPVDLLPTGLRDHELYKLGAPHARLKLEDDGGWSIRPLAPSMVTLVNGVSVRAGDVAALGERSRIVMGVTAWRFERCEVTLGQWERLAHDLLQTEGGAALFLKRHGGLCGPRLKLEPGSSSVIGRHSPRSAPEWELSGLPEHERRHIAYRHAQLRPVSQGWEIVPLTERHRVYINRQAISGPTRLNPGDEVALGSVLFHFHYPAGGEAPWRKNLQMPSLVDWKLDGAVPTRKEQP